MGATLSSVPLCSRADPATDDNNNVDNLTDNNLDGEEVNQNVIVAQQPAPVETSTPKIDRERYISRTRQINVYNIYLNKLHIRSLEFLIHGLCLMDVSGWVH